METYKKSMLTPVILRIVAQGQPVTVAEIATQIATLTGWQVTERGLYRTIKRLQDSDLLTSQDTTAPRTGAKRKDISLTQLGDEFLSRVLAELLILDQ